MEVFKVLMCDLYGKFVGKLDEFWNNEDEHWVDIKESNVIFPYHNQYESSECVTYHISELNNK